MNFNLELKFLVCEFHLSFAPQKKGWEKKMLLTSGTQHLACSSAQVGRPDWQRKTTVASHCLLIELWVNPACRMNDKIQMTW